MLRCAHPQRWASASQAWFKPAALDGCASHGRLCSAESVVSRTLVGHSARCVGSIHTRRSVFQKPKLPYLEDGDEGVRPVASKMSLSKHYSHFSQTVDSLNQLVEGTDFERASSLRKLIRDTSSSPEHARVHALASETWNHNFFWNCIAPKDVNPTGEVPEAMEKLLEFHFGSTERFKLKFSHHACAQFTNGWVWLVDDDGHLEILNTVGAACPLSYRGVTPLLCLDMWEHAYWDDYGDNKSEYVHNFLEVVDWSFVLGNVERTTQEQKKYAREPELRLWDYPYVFANDGEVKKAQNEGKYLSDGLDELMSEYEKSYEKNVEDEKQKQDEQGNSF